VIIAGAPEMGALVFFLACGLAPMGVTVLVPEREHAGELFWKNGMLGRRGVFTPAVEAFYRRGLLKKVVGGGQRPAHFENTDKFQFGRHLAGMMLNANQIDFSRWKHRLAVRRSCQAPPLWESWRLSCQNGPSHSTFKSLGSWEFTILLERVKW
jgi:2-polyprenyl-6-methoxyphenol hydroxylase-like FAD-dependent oxidoreductase